MTPTAVVFDLFHTLLDPDASKPPGFHRRREVARAAGLEYGPFETFWETTYVERETTAIDLVDLVDRHARAVGRELSPQQRERIDVILGISSDHGMIHPHPEIVEMLAAASAVTSVGVLSNCHRREMRSWQASPFDAHVDVLGMSFRIGVMKPDPAAYEWIIGRLAIDPDDAIYVGNGGSDELDGARRAGFGTIVHCNVFDQRYELVEPNERRRRAGQADVSVDALDDYCRTVRELVGA